MKKILPLFLAFLFCATTAFADDKPSQGEVDWFTYYYLDKDSSKVPDFLAELQRSGRLDKQPDAIPSIEGFLAVVFAANPANADNWAHAAKYTGKLKTAVDYALKAPAAPEAVDIKTTTDLDRTWGAFYASGDEKYLRKVENVLGKNDKKSVVLHETAAYSLGTNMTGHEAVDRFLKSESAARDDVVGKELKQIVDGVQQQRDKRAQAFPAHDGDFAALMFVTDPNLPAKATNEIVHFKEVSHAKIGDKRAVVIAFSGMQLSSDFQADVTYDITITDPAGKIFTDQKNLEAVKRRLPTRFRVFNNTQVVFLNFDDKDTPGEYKINATLSDNVAKKTLPLSARVTLEKAP